MYAQSATHSSEDEPDLIIRGAATAIHEQPASYASKDGPDLRIRDCAALPAQYPHDEKNLDVIDPSPCVVCCRHFNPKRQFFAHLGAGGHFREARYVQKRKAELDQKAKASKKEKRLVDWIRKDMARHD